MSVLTPTVGISERTDLRAIDARGSVRLSFKTTAHESVSEELVSPDATFRRLFGTRCGYWAAVPFHARGEYRAELDPKIL